VCSRNAIKAAEKMLAGIVDRVNLVNFLVLIFFWC
jgi:hypothetical protein